nr:hypothetical protein [Leisingera aquaemixtae]
MEAPSHSSASQDGQVFHGRSPGGVSSSSKVDLLLERAMAERRAREIQHNAVGLDDAGEAFGIDPAQATSDCLNKGALVQHGAQDADAAHVLAVEAFCQHHAVGEHLNLAPVEAGDEVRARPRRHVSRDRLGRNFRSPKRFGMVHGRAEENRAPVGGLVRLVLDHGLVEHGAVEHLFRLARSVSQIWLLKSPLRFPSRESRSALKINAS